MTETAATTFSSLLKNEDIAPTAKKLGLKSPSDIQSRIISSLSSGKDGVIGEEGADKEIASVLLMLSSEFSTEQAKGVTIIVCPTSHLVDMGELAEKIQLPLSPVGTAQEDVRIVAGTAAEVSEFFGGELSRSLDISRVVIIAPNEAEISELKQVLQSACKRGRRPQLVLLAASLAGGIHDLARTFFQASTADVKHLFLDVGAELLSKPHALADFLEGQASLAATLVFCNQPSDTDLLDVVLRKRGITTRKLVGNVLPQKVAQAVAQVQSGEVTALIVTDIAARNIEAEDFELVVNYSIHSDPEVYIHRTVVSRGGAKLRRVLSLVGPLDKANFHYLRKIVESPFESAPMPSKEELAKAQYQAFRTRAISTVEKAAPDEKITTLASLILADESKEVLIQYLLNQAATAAAASAPAESDERESSPPRRGERGDQRSQGDRSGDRGGRNDRNDRGGNNDRGNNDRGNGRGRPERGPARRRDGEESQIEAGADGNGDNEGREERRRERKPYIPPEKTARLYVGQGKSQGVTEEGLRDAITTEGEVPADKIKRISVRERYAFVDIPAELSDALLEKLDGKEAPKVSSSSLVLKRAITLNAPREDNYDEGKNSEEGSGNDGEMGEGSSNQGGDESELSIAAD